ncbi:hypothetical protein [Brevibacillus brevis]|uniref:hypothetical protein n=1 Tax=Brevibacillus brevis TaxID=1393 RepID=UPI00069DA218|nr:hypothetical protein [Brevibacillus brevis]
MFLDVVPFEQLVNDPNSPVVTLTLIAQGDRTEMIFHLHGVADHPGDKYMYDLWSDALDTLMTHLHDQKQ